MEIMELAAKLGQALKEDERLKKLEEARIAYESNAELQKNMMEYEVQQKVLQNEYSKEERDMIFVEAIQKRMNELYDAVMNDPTFAALNEAQTAVNDLMNAVNNTITYNITGKEPSSCTHDCSSCGGCH